MQSNLPALTHDVLMSGVFVQCEDGMIRFINKEEFKATGTIHGPVVFPPNVIDPRFINVLVFAPVMYHNCYRMRLEAHDIGRKIANALVAGKIDKELGFDLVQQLRELRDVSQLTLEAALEGKI